jgi:hypothetical protein
VGVMGREVVVVGCCRRRAGRSEAVSYGGGRA